MNTLKKCMWVSILGIFISGCAKQLPVDQVIINPAERMEFDGISVLPPQHEGWVLGISPIHEVVFKKQFKENSYLVGVIRRNVYERELNSSQDLKSYAYLKMKEMNTNLQSVAFNAVIDEARSKDLSADCIRYNYTNKKSSSSKFPEQIFVLTVYGVQCLHPSSTKVIIEAFCTERYPEENESVSESMMDECTAFLKNVQFKPLHSQTDNPYLDTPAWDAKRWQQIITAAKQANKENDNLKAEHLCYQAMSYSDSNTIKALFKYANFLDEIKREDSLAVRAKALRLMDLKAEQATLTQPKNTYLGFIPWEMLNDYANLLEKQLRKDEAESMRTLGHAYQYTQEVHAVRYRIILQGGNAHGQCIGFAG